MSEVTNRIESGSIPPAGEHKFLKVGTLRYTTFGLMTLFIWMLWGDLVWTLMEIVLPAVLPFKLGDMKAEWLIPIFLTTIPSVMVFTLLPVVSFRSDRYRSPRGRRIPYLLWTTPFLSAFLILFGLSDILGHSMYEAASRFLGFTINENALVLVLMTVSLCGYRYFDVYVNSIYYYLFNDVVPETKLATFNALMRVVGTVTGMAYNLFLFPHSLTHFAHIFVGAGVLYMFGFMLMCYKVKEGNYPPPPENIDKRTGPLSSIKTYAKECFTHRFYWYFFLMNTFMAVSWLTGVYGNLRNRDALHIDLTTLGRIGAVTGFVTLVILPFLGWLADKLNPIRCFVAMGFVLFINPFLQCVFIFKDFGPTGNTWFLLLMGLIILPFDTLQGTVEGPMYMRLLPKLRYGQFASANGTIRALAKILLSLLVGPFMALMIHLSPDRTFAYRLYPIWTVAFQVPAIICMLLLYREWKKLGGATSYVAPEVA